MGHEDFPDLDSGTDVVEGIGGVQDSPIADVKLHIRIHEQHDRLMPGHVCLDEELVFLPRVSGAVQVPDPLAFRLGSWPVGEKGLGTPDQDVPDGQRGRHAVLFAHISELEKVHVHVVEMGDSGVVVVAHWRRKRKKKG